jgi:hypothetical protein
VPPTAPLARWQCSRRCCPHRVVAQQCGLVHRCRVFCRRHGIWLATGASLTGDVQRDGVGRHVKCAPPSLIEKLKLCSPSVAVQRWRKAHPSAAMSAAETTCPATGHTVEQQLPLARCRSSRWPGLTCIRVCEQSPPSPVAKRVFSTSASVRRRCPVDYWQLTLTVTLVAVPQPSSLSVGDLHWSGFDWPLREVQGPIRG